MMETKRYLGDGLYAEFDGFGIWLLANSPTDPSDKVYLEPDVLRHLNEFVKSINENLAEQADQHAQADGPRAGEEPR